MFLNRELPEDNSTRITRSLNAIRAVATSAEAAFEELEANPNFYQSLINLKRLTLDHFETVNHPIVISGASSIILEQLCPDLTDQFTRPNSPLYIKDETNVHVLPQERRDPLPLAVYFDDVLISGTKAHAILSAYPQIQEYVVLCSENPIEEIRSNLVREKVTVLYTDENTQVYNFFVNLAQAISVRKRLETDVLPFTDESPLQKIISKPITLDALSQDAKVTLDEYKKKLDKIIETGHRIIKSLPTLV